MSGAKLLGIHAESVVGAAGKSILHTLLSFAILLLVPWMEG